VSAWDRWKEENVLPDGSIKDHPDWEVLDIWICIRKDGVETCHKADSPYPFWESTLDESLALVDTYYPMFGGFPGWDCAWDHFFERQAGPDKEYVEALSDLTREEDEGIFLQRYLGEPPPPPKPCSPGCIGHVTHPCERCGVQWGAGDERKLREVEVIDMVDDQPVTTMPLICGCWHFSQCSGRVIPKDGFMRCEKCGCSYGRGR